MSQQTEHATTQRHISISIVGIGYSFSTLSKIYKETNVQNSVDR